MHEDTKKSQEFVVGCASLHPPYDFSLARPDMETRTREPGHVLDQFFSAPYVDDRGWVHLLWHETCEGPEISQPEVFTTRRKGAGLATRLENHDTPKTFRFLVRRTIPVKVDFAQLRNKWLVLNRTFPVAL